MDKPIIIRNRPLEHYVLSVFSLFVQNKKKIILKGYGSLTAKTMDLANLIIECLLPGIFEKQLRYGTENINVGKNSDSYKISTLTITLKRK